MRLGGLHILAGLYEKQVIRTKSQWKRAGCYVNGIGSVNAITFTIGR